MPQPAAAEPAGQARAALGRAVQGLVVPRRALVSTCGAPDCARQRPVHPAVQAVLMALQARPKAEIAAFDAPIAADCAVTTLCAQPVSATSRG